MGMWTIKVHDQRWYTLFDHGNINQNSCNIPNGMIPKNTVGGCNEAY